MKKCALLFVIAGLLLAMGSCSSSRASLTASRVDRTTSEYIVVTPSQSVDEPVMADGSPLLAEAETWLGVPYRYGGNDREGVDCSGFVTNVFNDALGVKLPRTSASQSDFCRHLTRSELSPGDLVFFDTTADREGRVSHVGLYVGEGRMIHASSSRGVIFSDIDNPYYSSRFMSGGRVPGAEQALAARRSQAPETVEVAVNTPPVHSQEATHQTAPAPATPPSQPAAAPVRHNRAAAQGVTDPRTAVLNSLNELPAQ